MACRVAASGGGRGRVRAHWAFPPFSPDNGAVALQTGSGGRWEGGWGTHGCPAPRPRAPIAAARRTTSSALKSSPPSIPRISPTSASVMPRSDSEEEEEPSSSGGAPSPSPSPPAPASGAACSSVAADIVARPRRKDVSAIEPSDDTPSVAESYRDSSDPLDSSVDESISPSSPLNAMAPQMLQNRCGGEAA